MSVSDTGYRIIPGAPAEGLDEHDVFSASFPQLFGRGPGIGSLRGNEPHDHERGEQAKADSAEVGDHVDDVEVAAALKQLTELIEDAQHDQPDRSSDGLLAGSHQERDRQGDRAIEREVAEFVAIGQRPKNEPHRPKPESVEHRPPNQQPTCGGQERDGSGFARKPTKVHVRKRTTRWRKIAQRTHLGGIDVE